MQEPIKALFLLDFIEIFCEGLSQFLWRRGALLIFWCITGPVRYPFIVLQSLG
jgi:hypothetical protein